MRSQASPASVLRVLKRWTVRKRGVYGLRTPSRFFPKLLLSKEAFFRKEYNFHFSLPLSYMLRRAGVGVPEYIVIINRLQLDEITLSYMSNREKSRAFSTLNKQRDAFRGARDRGPSQNTGYYEVVSLVLST